MDSECLWHMIRDELKFVFLTKRKYGFISFGDNAMGRIIGQGNFGNNTSSLIENLLVVDGSKNDF